MFAGIARRRLPAQGSGRAVWGITRRKTMPSDYYFLRKQGVNEKLIQDLERYAAAYPVEEEVKNRVNKPDIPFYGKEILEMSVAALLQGENLLLTGAKATGKNVLAENLAWMFGRPVYNISFHVNTGSEELIGTDTFRNNEVQLRRGSISRCAQYGGFGILDEINMAKNDAISVLHAALDYRRSIDVPGYEKIDLHPATRFIGTMNYGYAGTRELNEALVSRFLVIDMPAHTEETLTYVLEQMFPEMKDKARRQLVGLFLDLQLKAENGEISTKCLDLRGLAAAVRTMKRGLSPYLALRMGIVNKSFDIFEKEIIQDVVSTRIPDTWTSDDVF
jgi:MoxR-like ATPase